MERWSILEHTTRHLLLEALAGAPWEVPLREGHQEDEPGPDHARSCFGRWEDQLRRGQREAIADVWRKVGRFLVGLGTGADQGYGEATWRRLYLTEVAPVGGLRRGRRVPLPRPGRARRRRAVELIRANRNRCPSW